MRGVAGLAPNIALLLRCLNSEININKSPKISKKGEYVPKIASMSRIKLDVKYTMGKYMCCLNAGLGVSYSANLMFNSMLT